MSRQHSRTQRLILFLTAALPQAFGTMMAMRRVFRGSFRQLSLSKVPL